MDVDVTPVFIDLGYERGEPPTYRAPSRSTVNHWFPITMLAVLVLLLATASAGPVKSPLSPLFRLPVGPADGYALTDSGDLLAQSYGRLASYDLGTGKVRWQAGDAIPAFRLRTIDGLVLLRPTPSGPTGNPATTAVSVTTGLARWERPGSVVTVPGSTALLDISGVQSYFGAGRRVQGTIEAVDPIGGGALWSVDVPSSAVMIGVPGLGDEGGKLLLVRDDQTVTLHDLDDGQVLATGKLPFADLGADNPVLAGGLLLLRHPGADETEISAYDPGTLKQVWTIPAAGATQVQSCGVIACLADRTGLRGLDPGTGDVLWSRPGWQSIEQQGLVYVAYGGEDGSEPIAVVDPVSAAMKVRLNGWRPILGSAGDGRLLVTRTDAQGSRTMVAVARSGDEEPRVLAELPTGAGDCQAAPDRLVCRSFAGELVVWKYRSEA